ncbi:hypothetical protein RIF29_10039 [Crotalaria pallida]|uniref:Uncharacterized protein n=1 Tax=Crotalaria pallida TaxID=3830 RepID=A0AAN9FYL7_CROPI
MDCTLNVIFNIYLSDSLPFLGENRSLRHQRRRQDLRHGDRQRSMLPRIPRPHLGAPAHHGGSRQRHDGFINLSEFAAFCKSESSSDGGAFELRRSRNEGRSHKPTTATLPLPICEIPKPRSPN